MNLRFVIHKIDSESSRRVGLFQAMDDLEESGLLDYELSELKDLYQWFKNNLKVPNRFSSAKNKRPASKAISWFKPSAKEHINKMYSIKHIFENNGYQVEVLKSEKPGYIVYEDKYQFCAEPFNETLT